MTPVDDTPKKTIQANNTELKENELHRALFDLEGLKNRGSEFIYKYTNNKMVKIDVLTIWIAVKGTKLDQKPIEFE